VDRFDIYLKLLETEPEVRSDLIKLSGGSGQLAFVIAQALEIKVHNKDAENVLGLSASGTRKRLKKIKGQNSPKNVPESSQPAPKMTRKRPLRKKPK
jgi:hypothetical protein